MDIYVCMCIYVLYKSDVTYLEECNNAYFSTFYFTVTSMLYKAQCFHIPKYFVSCVRYPECQMDRDKFMTLLIILMLLIWKYEKQT